MESSANVSMAFGSANSCHGDFLPKCERSRIDYQVGGVIDELTNLALAAFALPSNSSRLCRSKKDASSGKSKLPTVGFCSILWTFYLGQIRHHFLRHGYSHLWYGAWTL